MWQAMIPATNTGSLLPTPVNVALFAALIIATLGIITLFHTVNYEHTKGL
jgi:hypothetical protein